MLQKGGGEEVQGSVHGGRGSPRLYARRGTYRGALSGPSGARKRDVKWWVWGGKRRNS